MKIYNCTFIARSQATSRFTQPPLPYILQFNAIATCRVLFDMEGSFLYNTRGEVTGTTFRIQAISEMRYSLSLAMRVDLRSCIPVPIGIVDSWVRGTDREQCFGGDKLTSQVVYRCHRWLEDGAYAQPADLNTLPRCKAGLAGGGVVRNRRRIECVELKGHRNDSTVQVSSDDGGAMEGVVHTQVVTHEGRIPG